MTAGAMHDPGRSIVAETLFRLSSAFRRSPVETGREEPTIFPFLPDADGNAFHFTGGQLLEHVAVEAPTGPDRTRCLLDIASSMMSRGSGIVHVANGHAEPGINALLRLAEAADRISQVDIVSFDGSAGRPSVAGLRKSIRAGRIVSVWLPGPAYSDADNLRTVHAFLDMFEAAIGSGPPAPMPFVLEDPAPYVTALSAGLAIRSRSAGIAMLYGIENEASFGELDRNAAADLLANTATRIDLSDPAAPAVVHAGAPIARVATA